MMAASTPKISVILRTYNRKRYLLQTLKAIESQSCRDFELIVIDDGSKDGTLELLKRKKEITLVCQQREGYIKGAMKGLELARGPYVLFTDDDDFWDPRFFEQMLETMESGKWGVVYCDYRYFFGDRKETLYLPKRAIGEDLLADLIYANFIPTNTALIKREELERVGGVDVTLPSHENWDMWLRMACRGVKFQHLPETLVFIRKHQGNVTHNMIKMFSGALRVLEKNRKVIPSAYQKVAENSIFRLTNILGTVEVARGEKRKGRKRLIKAYKEGSGKSLFYLLLSYGCPASLLENMIDRYGRSFLKKEDEE